MINIPSDLRIRVVSSLILLPPVLYALYSGGVAFQILIVLAAVIMSFEWNNIISYDETSKLDLKQRTKWDVLGVIYIVIPCIALLILRSYDSGLVLCLWLFISVWSVDIAAYFTGKTLGGPKLIESISPNKTWSGFLGGMIASILVAIIFSFFIVKDDQGGAAEKEYPPIVAIPSVTEIEKTLADEFSESEMVIQQEEQDIIQDVDNNIVDIPVGVPDVEIADQDQVVQGELVSPTSSNKEATQEFSILFFMTIGALLAVIAQAGDFFESWVKRRFGVKDSGATIPGHGGLLDRVDGLITAAPFLLTILIVFGLS